VPTLDQLLLFLPAALALAVLPGPGILYVAARSLSGGRADGVASSFGTSLGGCVHIAAGAIGVSALVLASAELFFVLKLVGAAYLIFLGLRTVISARDAAQAMASTLAGQTAGGPWRAFREGALVEALNPKTAAFFLAFLPQFVDPSGHVAAQFVVFGAISVALNTAADLVVAFAAGVAQEKLLRGNVLMRVRQVSGGLLVALGAGLLLARRPVS
jgi:threonine/homoserine/homoserine lactone efflux protein